jgi:exodeoxyribonuclease VII large subunit
MRREEDAVPDDRALSVTEAMTVAKRSLESVQLRVLGEVSEFNDKPGYKAAYFTICDSGAVMPCMMWRDEYRASGVPLACGMLVELTGRFSAYLPKGRMQFVVATLSPAGEGRLRLEVAALARRLELEGLMRPEKKRALPAFPRRIAVITSPRGKAVHDVIRTLRRRYAVAELVIAGVQVEGADAPAEIVRGLEVVAAAEVDVALLVRGGGSYEDLMPFNSEQVARAIASMPMPLVTGIGHEPDNSIADMVADVRASTPTAAAEAVVPEAAEIRDRLDRESRLLARALAHRLQIASHRLQRCAERPVFSDSRVILDTLSQTVDVVGMALLRALPRRLGRNAETLGALRGRMRSAGPRMLERPRASFELASARLDDLSPLAILARGYALCFAEDGRAIVRSVAAISRRSRVKVRVADGSMDCAVEAVHRADGGVPAQDTTEV